jgi:hypothetical protein
MKQNKQMNERKALDRQVKRNGVPITDTEFQLSRLGYMTKAQLIEEILGSFSWDYLMENGLVSPRNKLVHSSLEEALLKMGALAHEDDVAERYSI